MDSCEAIVNNSDALASIFRYLSLNEQIKISKVCKQFESAVTQLIWRFCCKNVAVQDILPDTVIVKWNNGKSKTSMSYNQVNEFLKLTSSYIKIFELNEVKAATDQIPWTLVNLTSITFYHSYVDNNILLQLAKSCLKLNKIHMEYCVNLKLVPLVIERDIDIQIFEQIKELNDLTLIDWYRFKMNYQILQQLCVILKLRSLVIKSAIQIHTECFTPNARKNNNGFYLIEHLSIDRFYDELSWQKFCSNCLGYLKNLTKLTIKHDHYPNLVLNDSFLSTLAESCPQLGHLTLEQCDLSLKKFIALTNLSCLTISWCRGLTGSNLTDIFAMHKLQTLTVCCSNLKNNYDCGFSSQTLKSLYVSSFNDNITSVLMNPVNRFENVFTLNVFQRGLRTADNKLILKNISNIYPNLREFEVEGYCVSVEDFRRLNSLKLNLISGMRSPNLKQLLQLQSLKQLQCLSLDICEDLTKLLKNMKNIEEFCKDLTENLEYLKIPLKLFIEFMEFWLVFLQRNSKLKLEIFTTCDDGFFKSSFIEKLLTNKKFPRSLKHIQICDFVLDCEALKTGFEAALNRCNFQKDDHGPWLLRLQNQK